MAEVILGDLVLEWFTIEPGEVYRQTIRDLQVRTGRVLLSSQLSSQIKRNVPIRKLIPC